jgi:hypothetical protein
VGEAFGFCMGQRHLQKRSFVNNRRTKKQASKQSMLAFFCGALRVGRGGAVALPLWAKLRLYKRHLTHTEAKLR